MSYLALIGAVYWAVGVSSLACLSIARNGPLAWPIPSLKLKWDKHGFCDVCVGTIYIVVDSLVHVGLYIH